MIRRLRRRHRRIWIVLAVLLPLLYVVALAPRRPAPVLDSLPEPLREASTRPVASGAGSPERSEGQAGAVLAGERRAPAAQVGAEPVR